MENTDQFKPGEQVFYAGSFYQIAEIKDFPHGKMVGIYDEPPSKHIDYINPSSLAMAYSCPNCQNGCPACGGYGMIIQ